MKTTLTLVIVCCWMTSFFGQTIDNFNNDATNEFEINLGAFYSPILSKKLTGVNMEIKFYPYRRYATGLSISLADKNINDTFSYSIDKPILSYYEIGWLNQFVILQAGRIRTGIDINNGIVIARLGDNSIKEKYYTKYGSRYRAKEIETNCLYIVEPSVNLAFQLLSGKHSPDLYLTAKAKYRFAFGNTKYGQIDDFSNYYLGLGISLIGFSN